MASRLKWTEQEEEHIKLLKDVEGLSSWKLIAERLNQDIPGSSRSGKQCRERYINYVRFTDGTSKSSCWTEDDDRHFMSLYFEHGPQWASIVKFMPDKSENCLKNRFYGGLRRIIRKINRVEKLYKMRKSKPLRYQSLLRVLDYQSDGSDFEHSCIDFDTFLSGLKVKLLQSTWDLLNQDVSDELIIDLIIKIHEFNARVRGLTFTPSKNFERLKEKIMKANKKKEECIANETQATLRNAQGNKTSEEEEIFECLELPMPEGGEQSKFEEDAILEEMTEFCPKAEHTGNGEELEAEICQILQIEYAPTSFQFFE